MWWFLPFSSTSACDSILSLWDAPSPAGQVRACSSPSLHEVRRKIIRNHYLLYGSLPRSLGQRPYFALSKVHFLLFGCRRHRDCSHCYWDKTWWAKYCLDKLLACHALMEVLCWDYQAKTAHRDFHLSLTASLTCCVTLAKLLVTWLAEALVQIRSLCFNCPQEKKASTAWTSARHKALLLPRPARCTRRQMHLYRAAAPVPSPSSHASLHHLCWQMPFTPGLRRGRHSVRTANLYSSFQTNFCSLLKVFSSLPLNSNSSIFSAPGLQSFTNCLFGKDLRR